MPNPAKLSFTAKTDNVVWFANAAAWNTYLSSIDISISYDMLPTATDTEQGAVLKAAAPTTTYSNPSYGSTYYNIITLDDGAGGTTNIDAPTKAAFDQATTNIAQLKAIIDSLYAKLQAAGIIA